MSDDLTISEYVDIDGKALERFFMIEMAPVAFRKRLDDELLREQGKLPVPGFRPGKAPLDRLRAFHGAKAARRLMQPIAEDADKRIKKEFSLSPAGPMKYLTGPGVHPERGEDEPAKSTQEIEQERFVTAEQFNDLVKGYTPLMITVRYEEMPRFALRDWTGHPLRKPVAYPTAADIEETLALLAMKDRTFVKTEAPAEHGSRVTIDFQGFEMDGSPAPNTSGRGMKCEIGREAFRDEFEIAIIGMCAGDTRAFTLVIPGDERDAPPREVLFNVVVHGVERPHIVPYSDVDRDKLREALTLAWERQSRKKVHEELAFLFMFGYDFPLPQGMVEDRLMASKATLNREQSLMRDADKRARYRAERTVRHEIVIDKMIEEMKLTVSDEEFRRAVKEQMEKYPDHREAIVNIYNHSAKSVQRLKKDVLKEKVLDHLLSVMKVVNVPTSRAALFGETEDAQEAIYGEGSEADGVCLMR